MNIQFFMPKWLYRFLKHIKLRVCGSVEDRLRCSGMEIGENVHIFNSKIDDLYPYFIKIGDNVTITMATILAHDASIKKKLGYSKVGHVEIGDNVFIGAGAIILPGISIGDNVIIGAGTVVSKNIPGDSVVVGNPCQIIMSYQEFIDKHKKQMDKSRIINQSIDKLSGEARKKIMEKLKDEVLYTL